jgi:hypothetical protein
MGDTLLAAAGKRIGQAQDRSSQLHRSFLFFGKVRQVPGFGPVNCAAFIPDG